MSTDAPIAIERIDRAHAEGDLIRLSLIGRRLRYDIPGEDEPLLVVSMHGRRHRFQARRDEHGGPPPEVWAASFTIPFWAEPTQPGQASLWLGDVAVPVPVPGEGAGAPDGGGAAGAVGAGAGAAVAGGAGAGAAERADSAAEHRLRSELAETRSELGARTERLASLEAVQRELRADLEQLMAAIAAQREEFEVQLVRIQHERHELQAQAADAEASRDAALSETGGLRFELEHVGAELAVARELLGAHEGGLAEAEKLLVEAQAMSAELCGRSTQ